MLVFLRIIWLLTNKKVRCEPHQSAIPRPTAGQPLERSLKDLQARLAPQHKKITPFWDGSNMWKNHVVNVYIKKYIYIYIFFFLTNFQNGSLRSVFLRGSLWTVSWPYRQYSDNGVTLRQRSAGFWKRRFEGTLQCIGGGDRAGPGSWLHGPNPEADFGPTRESKKHKLQHTETERCETEFRISSSNKIQKQTDIDDGGWTIPVPASANWIMAQISQSRQILALRIARPPKLSQHRQGFFNGMATLQNMFYIYISLMIFMFKSFNLFLKSMF